MRSMQGRRGDRAAHIGETGTQLRTEIAEIRAECGRINRGGAKRRADGCAKQAAGTQGHVHVRGAGMLIQPLRIGHFGICSG